MSNDMRNLKYTFIWIILKYVDNTGLQKQTVLNCF